MSQEDYLINHIEKQLEEENLSAELRQLLLLCKEHFEKPNSICTIENAVKLAEMLHTAISLGMLIHHHT